MRWLLSLIVAYARVLGRINFLSGPIYRAISRIGDPERRERILGYVFSKAQLRQLQKHGRTFGSGQGTSTLRVKAAMLHLRASRGLHQRDTSLSHKMGTYIDDVYEKLPLSVVERRRAEWLVSLDTLREHSYAGANFRESFGSVGVFHARDLSLSKLQDARAGLQARVADKGRLTVILEIGAALPDAISALVAEGQTLDIHSFEPIDLSAWPELETRNVRVFTLRDQFNDISPAGNALFTRCRDTGESLSEQLWNLPSFAQLPGSLRQICALGTYDKLSHAVSLHMCVATALKKIRGPVLYVAASKGPMVSAPQALLRSAPKHTFIMPPMHRGSDTMARMRAAYLAGATLSGWTGSAPDASAYVGEIVESLGEAWSLATSHLRTSLDDTPSAFVVSGLSATDYEAATTELLQAAHLRHRDGEFPYPVHIDLTGHLDAPTSPDGSRGMQVSISALRASRVNESKASDLSAYALRRAGVRALHVRRSGLSLSAMEVARYADMALVESLTGIMPTALSIYKFAEAVAALPATRAALLVTSRNWMVRSFSLGLRDASPRMPVIDVQALNNLAHAKYVAPEATHASVIGDEQKRLFLRRYGMDPDHVFISGAVQDDRLRRQAADLDQRAEKVRLGLPEQARVVTLISQLQPFATRMAPIARAIATALKSDPDLFAIIRLHPRELRGRRDAYAALFRREGVLEKVRFSQSESPVNVLVASDCCVTIYSNMARMADKIGRPVLLANFMGWKVPLRLDKEGIGQRVRSQRALSARIRQLSGMDVSRPVETSSARRVLDGTLSAMGAQGETFSTLTRRAHPKLSAFDNVAIAATSDIDPGLLPPLVSDAQDVSFYSAFRNPSSGYLPGTTRYYSDRLDFASENYVEDAAALGNDLAHTLRDGIRDGFEGHPAVQSAISNLSHAIWLRLRPGLIDASKDFLLVQRGIRESTDALVIAAPDMAILSDLVSVAVQKRGSDVAIFGIDMENPDVLLAAEDVPDSPSEPPAIVTDDVPHWEKLCLRFGAWINGLPRADVEAVTDVDILVTTDWKLRTVPPSLMPLLERMQEDGHTIGLSNANPNHPALRKVAATLDAKLLSTTLRSEAFLSGTSQKRMGAKFASIAWKVSEGSSLSVRRAAVRIADKFARVWLPEILLFDEACRRSFADGTRISLACPGRQWHTEIAHGRAEAAGAFTMTLQNAYMTAGYTYTEPRGQYLTAIDAWSAELFERAYGVNPEKIHVTSTPRFDYLSTLATRSRTEARERLGMDADGPVVVYAAQVGPETENQAVAEVFAELSKRDDLGAHFVIKTHPRRPIERIQEFQSWARGGEADHEVSVRRDGDIEDYLAAADLCLTVFSNVGIEAAIADTPILIVNFSDRPLPVALDEFGLGSVARDADTLRQYIVRSLRDPEFQEAESQMRAQYRQANPLMASGGSTDTLYEVLSEHLENPDEAPDMVSDSSEGLLPAD